MIWLLLTGPKRLSTDPELILSSNQMVIFRDWRGARKLRPCSVTPGVQAKFLIKVKAAFVSPSCQCPYYVLQREDHHYPRLDFTQTELQQRFKRQLSIEQACTVTIDSVEAAKAVTENMGKMVKDPPVMKRLTSLSNVPRQRIF